VFLATYTSWSGSLLPRRGRNEAARCSATRHRRAQYAAALIGVVDRSDGERKEAIGKSYNERSNAINGLGYWSASNRGRLPGARQQPERALAVLERFLRMEYFPPPNSVSASFILLGLSCPIGLSFLRIEMRSDVFSLTGFLFPSSNQADDGGIFAAPSFKIF
jgi:hypothetical protein